MKITFEIDDKKIRDAVIEAGGNHTKVKAAFRGMVQDKADFIAETMLDALLAIKDDMKAEQ